MKKQLAYLIVTILGLSAFSGAQPFNKAQEKAFAQASIQLLECVLFVDYEFNSRIAAHLGTQLETVRQGFEAVARLEGVADAERANRAHFAPSDYNRRELLRNVQHYLSQIHHSLGILQGYLVATEADQRIGRYATGHVDGWLEQQGWNVMEYECDYATGLPRVDGNNQPIVAWAPPQNVVDHFVSRIRGELRALMRVMGPIWRDVYTVRSYLTVPEDDGESRFPINAEDVADVFMNRVGPNYNIDRTLVNEDELDVRRVINTILRDLVIWLDLENIEFPAIPHEQVVQTYRFHEGQREAFAHAMLQLLNWVMDAQNPRDLSVFERLLERLRGIRVAFRNVERAPTQIEQYEFLFGVVEGAVEDDESDLSLDTLLANTHARRVRNQRALIERDRATGAATFDYDGLRILDLVDRELVAVERIIGEIIAQMRLSCYYTGEILGTPQWAQAQRLLDGMINSIEPLLRNIYGIHPSNGRGIQNLIRGFEQWLEQFEQDYRLLGGLAPGEVPVPQRQITESIRALWDEPLQPVHVQNDRPVAHQMNAAAEPFHPNAYYEEEEDYAYEEEDFYGYEEGYGYYPEQVYPMGHIQIQQPQLQPGQEPPMYAQPQVIMVQPMYQQQYQPGYGYPQQQYYMPQPHPNFHVQEQGGYPGVPQQRNPNAGYHPNLQMPQPVRPVPSVVQALITGFGC